jgi:ubiquinol-cytochrome c reductase cytochrome c1 subunit
MTKILRHALAIVAGCLIGSGAWASGSSYPLDRFPTAKLADQAALQNGAKLFVNYCLNCHGASAMRYNRLRDIGLTEEQIKRNLMFTTDKVGDPMKVALRAVDAKQWFGALPPDLSLVARSRASEVGSGPDWLYTYLRSYYRDSERPTGWNNALFENVGMPHVLWEMQGNRGVRIEDVHKHKDPKTGAVYMDKAVTTYDASGLKTQSSEKVIDGMPPAAKTYRFAPPEGGAMSAMRYDSEVADLVAFITYMSDPTASSRTRIGVWVLLFLSIFTIFAWNLNRVYWKDVK